MEYVRFGLLFVSVLGAIWACDAGRLGNPALYSGNGRIVSENEITAMEINHQDEEIKVPVLENVSRKEKGCTLCEEYMTQTLDYLGENKTQTMVIDILHDGCSRTCSLRQECITLVDHYVPLFFLEVSTVQPEEFCRGYRLCQEFEMASSRIDEIREGLCQRSVSTVLSELKHPESQLQILESLFKACKISNSVEYHTVKCKRMVLMYGPQLLADAVKFLETSDVCSTHDACKFTASSKKASPLAETSVLPVSPIPIKNNYVIRPSYFDTKASF